tara:strand:+ start:3020 stop:3526 length:507 start_codon:yes stop_codon:yes gene_type:complete
MKKILTILILLGAGQCINAQKFAYVDSKYILNKIPEFKQAQEKIDALSIDWQKEIEEKYDDLKLIKEKYEQDKFLLTESMQQKREDAIEKKENKIIELQNKYFGPQGELYIKKQELIKPIQDKIYDAIQKLASDNKYSIVFDSSSDLIMLYKSNKLDKSDKILDLMGY